MKTVKTVKTATATAIAAATLTMAGQASAAAHPEPYSDDATKALADKYGEFIMGAQSAYDGESSQHAKLMKATDDKVQALVKACLADLPAGTAPSEAIKGNARTNTLLRFIPQALRTIYSDLDDKTITNYATSFKIAFRDGVTFERGLFRGEKKAAKPSAPKPPKVVTLEKFCKAIQSLVEMAEMLEADKDVKAFKVKLVKAADAHFTWRAEDAE